MAIISKPLQSDRRGFTIVELLIVIVVIGILAAITIVAFNGIQSRANTAVLQADLNNLAKKIQSENALTGTYPDTLSGMSGSAGTLLEYTRTAGGASFCLTGQRGNTVNSASSTDKVSTTGCPITNLVDNPSLEANTSNWSPHTNFTQSRVQVNGEWTYRVTRNGTGAAAIYIGKSNPFATPDGSYSASIWVTTSVTTDLSLRIRDGTTNNDRGVVSTVSVQANTPTQLFASADLTGFNSAHIAILSSSGAVGDVITADKAMFTAGTGKYVYADGATPGWSWNGGLNNSTSTGPAALLP